MSVPASPVIYLAGPEVFLKASQRNSITAQKRRILAEVGMTGLDPMDNELALADQASPMMTARAIYAANIRLIHRCDGALVNLTPFRGASADAGTVFETGYLAALGKPMMGYTLHAGDYEERVYQPDAAGMDEFGRAVERFGQVDNLMIESAILSSGGEVIRGVQPVAEGFGLFDQQVFRTATAALARQFRQGPAC